MVKIKNSSAAASPRNSPPRPPVASTPETLEKPRPNTPKPTPPSSPHQKQNNEVKVAIIEPKSKASNTSMAKKPTSAPIKQVMKSNKQIVVLSKKNPYLTTRTNSSKLKAKESQTKSKASKLEDDPFESLMPRSLHSLTPEAVKRRSETTKKLIAKLLVNEDLRIPPKDTKLAPELQAEKDKLLKRITPKVAPIVINLNESDSESGSDEAPTPVKQKIASPVIRSGK